MNIRFKIGHRRCEEVSSLSDITEHVRGSFLEIDAQDGHKPVNPCRQSKPESLQKWSVAPTSELLKSLLKCRFPVPNAKLLSQNLELVTGTLRAKAAPK